MEDHEYMLRAIALGEKGHITAPPNPWVGCLIVKEGKIVGEGYHVAPGEPHAEIVALKEAGERAKGATMYVTLEPCVHHGRTPPCANSVIEAGLSRVVVGVEDPDHQVSGKGMQILRDAGIEVLVGVCANEVYDSLKPYLHQRKTGRPFCVAKSAISIDGRTAAADRSSKWITPPEARADAHRIRAESQAILIGTGTALTDNPKLTVREIDPLPERKPLRVLLDTHGRVSTFSPLFDISLAPTLIFTSSDCKTDVRKSWEDAGAEVVEISKASEGIGLDLQEMMENLFRRGIVQLMIEGGATLFGTFLKQGYVDQLVVYIGSCILGDKAEPLFRGMPIESMDESISMKLVNVRKLENSVRLDYVPS